MIDGNDDSGNSDEELYGTKRTAVHPATKSFRDSPYLKLEKSKKLESKIGVLATLHRCGPFQDYAVGHAATDKVQWASRSSPVPLQRVGTTGSDSAGALSVVQESVWPHVITSFPMSACDEIFALQLKSATKTKKPTLQEGQMFFILSLATSSMASIQVSSSCRPKIAHLLCSFMLFHVDFFGMLIRYS